MVIKTSDPQAIQAFTKNLYIPPADSHKGENGKLLIIGGSKLFHSASLWAAEVSTHFNDMVHYASTKENAEIFTLIKSKFRNGIVIEQKDVPWYAEEDDAILMGPGMVRDEMTSYELQVKSYEDVLKLTDEAEYTHGLVHYLIHHFPHKRFVLDAGALQMMDPEWLKLCKQKPIITPHQLEFERLFGVSIREKTLAEKQEIVKEYAGRYNVILLLKAVVDIISDGTEVYVIEGGNQGLTKGGSGDILAGFTASLYTKNDPLASAIIASFIEKKAAEELKKKSGYWYNMDDLIKKIPEIFTSIIYN